MGEGEIFQELTKALVKRCLTAEINTIDTQFTFREFREVEMALQQRSPRNIQACNRQKRKKAILQF